MMEGTGGYKPENPHKKKRCLENSKRRERFGFEMCSLMERCMLLGSRSLASGHVGS